MDMYDPSSGKFLTANMLGSEFAEDHRSDADNSYLRSVIAVNQLAAILLHAPEIVQATGLARDYITSQLRHRGQDGFEM